MAIKLEQAERERDQLRYTCTGCGSKGFHPSVLPNRCTFCDGTENGGGPYRELQDKLAQETLRHHRDESAIANIKLVAENADLRAENEKLQREACSNGLLLAEIDKLKVDLAAHESSAENAWLTAADRLKQITQLRAALEDQKRNGHIYLWEANERLRKTFLAFADEVAATYNNPYWSEEARKR